ncbi:MAG TPA: hypothetical protein VFK13_11665 [Gemmatimonadaceae bacterium]|nr:hypothetical protein [Gemmatimonadaceae bacterium]
MRAVCIARHPFLSEHIAAVCADAGIEGMPAVGFEEGVRLARAQMPDVVLCDYDLLATSPLRQWEDDPDLSRTPVIAVSLTRRPEEVNLLDRNAIAGFLYLPLVSRDAVSRVIAAASSTRVRPPRDAFLWKEREERAPRSE